MWDAEALKSRTRPLLKNREQNMFTYENNLESMKVP